MFLTYFLAVASVAHLSRLRLCVLLAHAVFTKQVWCTSIDGIAEVSLTSERTVALFWDVRVQGYRRESGEVGVWGRRQIPCPVKIAARSVRAAENVFESYPGSKLGTQWIYTGCEIFVHSCQMGVQLPVVLA
jgi:hypothetical protein